MKANKWRFHNFIIMLLLLLFITPFSAFMYTNTQNAVKCKGHTKHTKHKRFGFNNNDDDDDDDDDTKFIKRHNAVKQLRRLVMNPFKLFAIMLAYQELLKGRRVKVCNQFASFFC